MLDNLYQKTILDHFKRKRNFHELKGEDVLKTYYKNPTCGDIMTLYVKLENSLVKEVAFWGEGCTISMASCSMMTELIKGRNIQQINQLRNEADELIKSGKVSDELEEWNSLIGVHKLKGRHNCALMPWQAFDKFLKKIEQK